MSCFAFEFSIAVLVPVVSEAILLPCFIEPIHNVGTVQAYESYDMIESQTF